MYLESADDLIDQRNEFLNVPRLEQNKENLWITQIRKYCAGLPVSVSKIKCSQILVQAQHMAYKRVSFISEKEEGEVWCLAGWIETGTTKL